MALSDPIESNYSDPFDPSTGNDTSPDEISRRRRWAQMVMQQGMSTEPINAGKYSPIVAIARALQGALGGYFAGKAERDQKAADAQGISDWAAAVTSENNAGGWGATPSPATKASAVSPIATDKSPAPPPGVQVDNGGDLPAPGTAPETPTLPGTSAVSTPSAIPPMMPQPVSAGPQAEPAWNPGPSAAPPMAAPPLAPPPQATPVSTPQQFAALSPRDRDAVIRTLAGEAGNQGPEGQAAVLAVIRNRVANGNYGGTTPYEVAHAPHQFEAWHDPNNRLAYTISPNSPGYQKIAQLVDTAWASPNDPTNGATNFYAPSLQAQRRRSVPSWAQGTPTAVIGGHQFFAPGGAATPAPSSAPLPSPEAVAWLHRPGSYLAAQDARNGASSPPAPVASSKWQAMTLGPTDGVPDVPGTPVQVAQNAAAPTASDAAPIQARPSFTPQEIRALQNPNTPAWAKQSILSEVQTRMHPSWAPQTIDLGTDAFGNSQKKTVLFNKDTAEMRNLDGTPLDTGSSGAGAGAGKYGPTLSGNYTDESGAELTGKPLLDAIKADPGMRQYAQVIDDIAHFRAAPKDVSSYKGNMRTMLWSLASRASDTPGFSESDYNKIYATNQEFTHGGKSSVANTITAGNTAIHHLGELSDYAEHMGNADLYFTGPTHLYNSFKNSLTTAGQAKLNQFETLRDKYVKEVETFYSGGSSAGTAAERDQAIQQLKSAGSPQELRAAIQANVAAIEGKVNELQDRWHQGTMNLAGDFPIIRNDSQQQLVRIKDRYDAGSGADPYAGTGAQQPSGDGVVHWSDYFRK